MEAHCLPGRINISENVAGHVKALFELEPRGSIEAKHEQVYEMYFLNRLRQEFSPASFRSTCSNRRRIPGRQPG